MRKTAKKSTKLDPKVNTPQKSPPKTSPYYVKKPKDCLKALSKKAEDTPGLRELLSQLYKNELERIEDEEKSKKMSKEKRKPNKEYIQTLIDGLPRMPN
jgi:hypothetical protein